MDFERAYHGLHVVLTRDRAGRITTGTLEQGGDETDTVERMGPEQINLTRDQLYALVDWVAVADPDEWARRFPQQEEAERALRRVADYLRTRAENNRRFAANAYFRGEADAFDISVTRVMEEIEALYPEVDPTQAVNHSLNRRS
jgi:hypothetical protein